jgi:hypothetical protein
MWQKLSENSFVGALVSGLLIIFLVWLFKFFYKKYRANQVYKILENSLKEKNKNFLPTAYLAAKSDYTQADIESLCSHHKKICRNEKELESWRIK